MLTRALLDRFESLLVEVGSPLPDLMYDGLSPAEVEAVCGEVGVEVSPEAYVWWGWANGTDPTDEPSVHITPGFWPISLCQAIDERDVMIDVLEMLPPEMQFRADWMPFLRDFGGGLVVYESGVTSGPSPIRLIDTHRMPIQFDIVRFGSMALMVHAWIDAIEGGRWQFDADHKRCHSEEGDETLPAELRGTGLV